MKGGANKPPTDLLGKTGGLGKGAGSNMVSNIGEGVGDAGESAKAAGEAAKAARKGDKAAQDKFEKKSVDKGLDTTWNVGAVAADRVGMGKPVKMAQGMVKETGAQDMVSGGIQKSPMGQAGFGATREFNKASGNNLENAAIQGGGAAQTGGRAVQGATSGDIGAVSEVGNLQKNMSSEVDAQKNKGPSSGSATAATATGASSTPAQPQTGTSAAAPKAESSSATTPKAESSSPAPSIGNKEKAKDSASKVLSGSGSAMGMGAKVSHGGSEGASIVGQIADLVGNFAKVLPGEKAQSFAKSMQSISNIAHSGSQLGHGMGDLLQKGSQGTKGLSEKLQTPSAGGTGATASAPDLKQLTSKATQSGGLLEQAKGMSSKAPSSSGTGNMMDSVKAVAPQAESKVGSISNIGGDMKPKTPEPSKEEPKPKREAPKPT